MALGFSSWNARDKLEEQPSPFSSKESLFDFIERLIIPLGRRIDATQPFLEGRLVDGSRFHVILPPLAADGPCLSIRKSRVAERVTLAPFCDPPLMEWTKQEVRLGNNVLIAGATGSGKTTCLSALMEGISPTERVIVIEESRELAFAHPHLISLEARPPSPDGIGEVTLRTLLRNALRMRPDRIILGECRGVEALDLLQVMNTGHRGSLSTLHANSARDALRRLEALVLLSGLPLSVRPVREWIAAAIALVVFLEREGNSRTVREVISIEGMEGGVYRLTPVFPRRAGVMPLPSR